MASKAKAYESDRTTIAGRGFTNLKLLDKEVRDFAHLELDRVTFTGCVLSVNDDTSLRRGVTDVVARRCRLNGSLVDGLRFDEVTIEDLATGSGFRPSACVFRHATLKGKIGSFVAIGPSDDLEPRFYREFRESAEAFYQALDISEARFSDSEF